MMTFMGVVLVFVSMFSALCYYIIDPRSEERRVGKECRSGGAADT